jgi:hypothetical protein
MKSNAVILALAAVASASPMSKRLDPAAWDKKETLCKGWDGNGWDTRTPEGVDKLWEDSGAGGQLDMFILMQWGRFTPRYFIATEADIHRTREQLAQERRKPSHGWY